MRLLISFACFLRLLPVIGLALANPAALAEAPPSLNLTAAEKAWLAAHPVIRLGVDPAYAPYAFIDAQGQPAGVSAELTALVGKRLGIRLELVPGLTWPQLMDGLRQRRVDLVTTVAHLPEREEFIAFTRIYLPTPLVVMTRAERPRLLDLRELERGRVALVKGYSSTRNVLDRLPGIDALLVADPLEGLQAVSQGRAEAYIGVLGVNTYLASRHGISNLKVNTGFDMANGQRYGVRKDWPELATLLEKALDSIPAAEQQAIFARWISIPVESVFPSESVRQAGLLARAATFPELRIGVLPGRPPFDFVDKHGTHAGLSADVLELLVKYTGLKVRTVTEASMEKLLERFDAGELDLVLAMNGAAPGAPAKLLSAPYFVSTLGVYTRKGDVFLGALDDLLDRRVALLRGGYAEEILRAYPRVVLQPHADLPAAARALLEGKADYLVAETTASLRTIEESGIAGLRYAGPLSEAPVTLRLAVSPRRDGLQALINDALAMITPPEASAIRRQWVSAPLESGFGLRRVLQWAAAILLLVGLGYAAFILWNHRLRREIVRRTESERTAREFSDSVLETVGAIVVALDRQGRIVRFNRACEQLTGYTEQEAHGRYVWDFLLPAEQIEAVKNVFVDLTAGQVPNQYENEWLDRNGERHRIAWSNNALLDTQGNVEHVIATGIDITARKRAERALAESEEKFRTLTVHSPVGIFMDNAEGKAIYINRRCAEMVGVPAEQALDTDWVKFIHPDDRERVTAAWAKAVSGGLPFSQDYRWVHPDGRVVWTHGEIAPVHDTDGRAAVFIGTLVDITGLKNAERELEQRNQEMERFIYTISHDLKSPLITISGFANFLARDIERGDLQRGSESITEIRDAADGMQQLIEDLLLFSRTGQIKGEPEEVDLQALLREVQARCASHIERERATIRVATSLPRLRVDRARFSQVMQNLLDNGVKFHREGVDPVLEVGAADHDGGACLYVRDNGIGIEKRYQEKIFGLFQRMKTDREGTGVGLAIARRIVEQHGGKLWVESEPGKGSTFWISLPDSVIVPDGARHSARENQSPR